MKTYFLKKDFRNKFIFLPKDTLVNEYDFTKEFINANPDLFQEIKNKK